MDASLRSRAEELANEFASQATTAEGLNGLMRLMMKSVLDRTLKSEMDVHLGRKALASVADGEPPRSGMSSAAEPSAPAASSGKRSPNRRNGPSQKTVQGDLGELTIVTLRDRDGTFEPQLIGRHQRRVPTQFEVASGDVRLAGTIVDVDPQTGRAQSVRRLRVTQVEAQELARLVQSPALAIDDPQGQ